MFVKSSGKRLSALLALSLSVVMVLSVQFVWAQPGGYTGTAPGWGGPLTVSVAYADGVITTIEILDHSDTIGIGDVAFDIIARRIIDNQSLAVDHVSGATLSSFGVTLAVTAALTEAGADLAALRVPPPRPAVTRGPTENVDVVIVGSGFAGLMAAVELMTNYPDATFVLLEQMDIIGGQTATTGGVIYSPTSPMHREHDLEFDVQVIVDLFEFQSREPVREALIRNIFDLGDEIMQRLLDMGAVFGEPGSWGAGDYFINAFRHQGHGPGFATFFHNFVGENPFDLRTGSRATGLLVNADGVVYGVSVLDREHEYEIHAGAVLLATGGFGANDDVQREFAPLYVGNHVPRIMPGATGDGILFTRQFGTPVVGDGVIFGALRPSIHFGTVPANFIVSTDGVRIANESYVLDVIEALDSGNVTAFRIGDYDLLGGRADLAARLEAGVLVQHDSLEDLAADRGINAPALLETVAAFNAAIAAGDSPGFGLPVAAAAPVLTAPFFSERAATNHIGTIPGILVDDYKRVLDGAHNPVPGLYAAGEVMFGNLFTRIYPAGGTAISLTNFGGPFAIRTIMNDLGF